VLIVTVESITTGVVTIYKYCINPLIPTLKLHSNRLLHSNTVIDTLAVDGWAVTFGTARRGLGVLGPA